MKKVQRSPSTTTLSDEAIKKLLIKYDGIFKIDPTDTQRCICIKCEDEGLECKLKWISADGHLKGKAYSKKKVIPSKPKCIQEDLKQNDKTDAVDDDLIIKEERFRRDDVSLYFKLAKFILENSFPFSFVEPLLNIIQEISENYQIEVIRKAHLSRTVLSKIVKDCIAGDLKDSIFSRLETTPFSLAIDEASDVFGSGYLAITAKFLKTSKSQIPTNKLIAIIPMGTSSTGQVLCQKILNRVLINDLIKKNFMGIATDGAKNMTGRKNGVGALLLQEFPYIYAMKDLSHSYNLIFKYALKDFPKEIRYIVKELSSHFKQSPQRRALLMEVQKEMGLRPLTMLYYVKTRWLSYGECLSRIIEIWNPLKEYFTRSGSKKKDYFSLKNECYLKVLLVLIERLNHYNEFFHREHIFYDQIVRKIRESYMFFAGMVLNVGQEGPNTHRFADYFDIDLESTKITMNNPFYEISKFKEVFFAEYYTLEPRFINELEQKDLELITVSSHKFIVKVLKEMRERLPFQDTFLSDISIVFLKEFEKSKWERLGNRFSNIILKEEQQIFRDEIKKLSLNFEDVGNEVIVAKSNPIDLWRSKEDEYPFCSKLAIALFVLPHSTISVERVFSTLKNTKNVKRNRLTIENLEACLLSFEASKTEDILITESMIQRYSCLWKNANQVGGEEDQTSQSEEEDNKKENKRKAEENLHHTLKMNKVEQFEQIVLNLLFRF